MFLSIQKKCESLEEKNKELQEKNVDLEKKVSSQYTRKKKYQASNATKVSNLVLYAILLLRSRKGVFFAEKYLCSCICVLMAVLLL